MAYYSKMYDLGSATDVLKKPDEPRKKPASPAQIAKIRQEIQEKREKAASKTEEIKIKSADSSAGPKNYKVFLGIPCYKTIHIRTMDSIVLTLLTHHPDIDFGFMNGIFVHENQNKLVEMAREKKATHLFLVEHDMVFQPDTLEKLLELDKDVVSAPYAGRKLPLEPLVYDNTLKGELYMMQYDMWPDKPTKVYGVPTGCTLIKMEVFDKIKKPYFFYTYNEEGVMESSQDIYFSKKVNDAGMECWIDPTIPVTHIGEFDYLKK